MSATWGGRRPGAGHPAGDRKDPDQSRTVRLAVNCTPEEARIIREQARLEGVSASKILLSRFFQAQREGK